MHGLKSGDIKVQVEEDNVLVVCYKEIVLPDRECYLENINAVCQDGVLIVTMEKLTPPHPKMPKLIEVRIAQVKLLHDNCYELMFVSFMFVVKERVFLCLLCSLKVSLECM